jgi:hypothetical protein
MNKIIVSEYDAFGPWIYVIDEQHKLPKLYREYKDLLSDALIAIKIPRSIERRRANADMHLYDAVIALFPTYLLSLNRDGDNVIETRVSLNDIYAIKNTIFLLQGTLLLYNIKTISKIGYNSVSAEIINDLIDKIRSLKSYQPQPLRLSAMHYDTDTIDYLYVNLINRLKKSEENIRFIAYQPTVAAPARDGFFGKLLDKFSPKLSLSCTAFITNDKELIIIERQAKIIEKGKTGYAYSYLYLPIIHIGDMTIKDDINLLRKVNRNLSRFI